MRLSNELFDILLANINTTGCTQKNKLKLFLADLIPKQHSTGTSLSHQVLSI